MINVIVPLRNITRQLFFLSSVTQKSGAKLLLFFLLERLCPVFFRIYADFKAFKACYLVFFVYFRKNFMRMMRKKGIIMSLTALMLAMSACTTHYQVSGVSRTRLLIDRAYDGRIDDATARFMQPFTMKVDSLVSPVVGKAAMPLETFRPESPLSNLMADVLVWSGKDYGEKPDFGVYNIGGIRASLAKGDIRIGDIFDVAPFENKVCFVTLTGEKVTELLGQIAGRGGEGISKEVRIVMTKDKKLKRATLQGKEIIPTEKYRIATVDYVSHGNDGMSAFKSSMDRNELTEEKDLTRMVLMRYVKECTANGKMLESKVEGRIIVEE